MANGLKMILPDLISDHQSALGPRRLITDDSLVAFEVYHAMKKKGECRTDTMTLKFDMSKAYDHVEWVFLEWVMLKLGFDCNWVRRIMDCWGSVSFAFKCNGGVGCVFPSLGLH